MRRATLTLSLALTLAAPVASANGRFPSSSYLVVGPGDESRVIALRATFGIITSYDGGRTWGWVCEEAFDTSGAFDASLEIGFDGTLVVGTPRGISITRSGCSWGAPRGDPMRSMADLAGDSAGRHLVSAIGPDGTNDALVVSNDGGASWTMGVRLPDFFIQTVEMAPSDPRRVYVSGFVRGGIPVLLRSDDGGMTTREVARADAFRSGMDVGTDVFISGVDPTNPDVIYIRSALGLGTMLMRSDNAGASWRELTRSANPMSGFALSDDGATVWAGSSDRAEGITRSVRGGPFTRVAATVSVRCLRQHAGVLYVCADEVADGYLLGTSINGGDRIDALFSARLLAGPSSMCTSSTQVGMVCGPLWPAQRMALADIDAGAPPPLVPRDASVRDVIGEVADVVDAGTADTTGVDVETRDATRDAADEAPVVIDAPAVVDSPAAADTPVVTDAPVTTDAPTAMDAPPVMDATADALVDAPDVLDRGPPPPPPKDGCGCHVGAARGPAAGYLGFLALVAALRRRTRRT